MVLLFVSYHLCNILSWIVSAFLIQKFDSDLPSTTIIKATAEKQVNLHSCSTLEGRPAGLHAGIKATRGESNLDIQVQI